MWQQLHTYSVAHGPLIVKQSEQAVMDRAAISVVVLAFVTFVFHVAVRSEEGICHGETL